MALWWAESCLMAAWWLVWGGFGAETLRRWGVERRPALLALGVVWVLGWVRVTLIPAWGPVDLGLLALTAAALFLTVRGGQRTWALAWVILGTAAALARGAAPIHPLHQTFVPWLVAEAAALGLLAGAVTLDPAGAAAVAALGSALASLLRLFFNPVPEALAGPDWLYTILAASAAWSTAWVLGFARRSEVSS